MTRIWVIENKSDSSMLERKLALFYQEITIIGLWFIVNKVEIVLEDGRLVIINLTDFRETPIINNQATSADKLCLCKSLLELLILIDSFIFANASLYCHVRHILLREAKNFDLKL